MTEQATACPAQIDLAPYLQRDPDLQEDVPAKMARSQEIQHAKFAIMDLLPLGSGVAVLDVGSACGWAVQELMKRYRWVTALTLFEAEAAQIRKAAPKADTLVCDMHKMPKAWAGQFTIIRASHVLEHSPAPYVALCEFARVLKPGGTLQVVIPNADGYTGLHQEKPRRCGDMPAHVFCGSMETVIELIRHAGRHESGNPHRLRFDSYHEIPQWCQGQIHYMNRVFMATKTCP